MQSHRELKYDADERSSFDAVEHANVQAAHDTDKLLISQDEANEVDEESKKRLLSSRKLSLVVDLDQTIIHAAVDPTIGEWQNDPENPNYEALKDVRKFQLVDDGQGMRGCWYYIKLRPGLEAFLERISEKYELHIYTMGTRQYAQHIAQLVDPDRKYFDDRILSRDESGSMIAKNLTRLFPVDTKMVVIIDDRGDVWKWSPNLVRVSPFDFFVGIGDINAGFLPKKQEVQATPNAHKDQVQKTSVQNGHKSTPEEQIVNGETSTEEKQETDTTALQQVVAMSSSDALNEDMEQTQEKAIASQLEEKPLLKLQQQMDEKDAVESNTTPEPATQGTDSDSSDSESSISGKKRHSILRNDDEELIHLERSLRSVHERFFNEYDRRRGSGKGGRVAALAGKRKEPLPEAEENTPLQHVPDVKKIMPNMKERVLGDVVIVFSGVLPLGTDVQTADISIWARTFGARIEEKVTKSVTHVVAARVGTSKVKTAVKRGIKVVSTQWLTQSIQRWKKLDERPYLVPDIGQKGMQEEPPSEPQEAAVLDDVKFGPPGDFLLSSEEDTPALDDTDDNHDDQPKRKKPKLEIDMPADNEDIDPDVEAEPHSPIDMSTEAWKDIDAELADFMGSDMDSESDAESVKSDRSSSFARRPKKRQRDDDDEGDSESDGDTRNGDHKRQRSSRNTGSSLKTVNNVESVDNTPAPGDEDLDDDELARELEAELEAVDDDD